MIRSDLYGLLPNICLAVTVTEVGAVRVETLRSNQPKGWMKMKPLDDISSLGE